jgi:hypothetical protein
MINKKIYIINRLLPALKVKQWCKKWKESLEKFKKNLAEVLN